MDSPSHETFPAVPALNPYPELDTSAATDHPPGADEGDRAYERIRLATHAAGIGIWEWDVASDDVLWDDEVKRVFGVPLTVGPQETQSWWRRLVYLEDQGPCEALRVAALSGERNYQHEYRITRANDGAERIIRSVGEAYRDAAGRPVRVVGCVWDVTEQRRRDEALREKTEELNGFFDSCNGLLGISDLDGRIVYLNPEWERVLGYSPDEVYGRVFLDFIHPDDVARTHRDIALSKQGQPSLNIVNRYRHRDGSYRWLQWRSVVRGSRIYGTAQDITESWQAEQVLRASLARSRFLSELIEDVSQPFAVGYQNGRIEFANGAFCELLGYSKEAIESINWLENLWPAELRSEVQPALDELRHTRQPFRVERRLPRSDGSTVPVELLVHVMRDQHGDGDCFVCFLTDLTERRRAEKALRHSEEQYRQIVENAAQGIWIVDNSGVTTFANRRLAEMLGYSIEEIVGRPFSDFTDEEGRASCAPLWEVYRQGAAGEHDFRYVRKDGSDLWTTVTIRPITDDQARFQGAMAMVTDITERRKAAHEKEELLEQLHQAQRLESVGRLAGGIAHDFNNVLTVINGYSAMMLKRLRDGDPLRSALVQVHKAGSRAADLVEQLLTFTRKTVSSPKPQNLNTLILEVRDMLERVVGEDILLVASLSPDLGYVTADDGQLHQVVMNLVINARDAMPRGGSLTLETSNVELGGDGLPVPPGLTPGPYVLLTCTDSGSGMEETVRRRIFEPFFTTKQEGRGSGLGLFAVYGIVRQYGGWISVESSVGRGTTFLVLLPRTEAPAAAEDEVRPEPASLRGTETILVVEDQEDVRQFAVEALTSYGYHVLEAAMGGEALLLAESHPGPIHLMLSDIVMPRMTGMELATRLKPLRPAMRVLYMSAYSNRSAVPDSVSGDLKADVPFLAKPFSPDALAAKVRSVLGAPGSRGSILVMEVDEGVRRLYENVLGAEGYEVFLASDRSQAAKFLQERFFNLVIANVSGVGHENHESIQLVRTAAGRPKVLGVTGCKGAVLPAKLGVDATLPRPVNPEQLLSTVAGLLI
jgi:two-component system, cell cycle sensor histidine kinase and response regulator CckA